MQQDFAKNLIKGKIDNEKKKNEQNRSRAQGRVNRSEV